MDDEGFIWSFGENNEGQLGTENKTNFNVPQKILDIPPVLSVSCGSYHTLIITTDSNFWSCGNNEYGQLCHGDKEDRPKPQKTSSATFHKYQLVIFIHYFKTTMEKYLHVATMNSENVDWVISILVGYNLDGNLGLGHHTHQNILNKISNIPRIKTISCVYPSCYLIDFEGNVWSFGYNAQGQLGHGDTTYKNTPKIINTLKDIQQISHGCCGRHFFAKNSQNQIFVTGNNDCGQLGTGDRISVSIPKEINSQYSYFWGDVFHTRTKSARK